MMRPDRERCGFTLMEVIVALAVGAVILLGCRALLEGVVANGKRIALEARSFDRDANGERLLRELALEAQVSVAPRVTFGGQPRSARFTSWCRVPRGWREPCTVELAVDGTSLVANLPGGPLRFDAALPVRELRYLASAENGGEWVRGWGESLTLPEAIGVIRDGDTLLLRVGSPQ